MKFIDLTLELTNKITVFSSLPKIKFSKVWTLKKHGWNITKIEMPTHMNATHMDAPFHKIKNGKKLSEFPIDKFFGKGVLINCRGKKELTKDVLKNVKLRKGDFVLFFTGHMKSFGTKKYDKEQPFMTVDLAKELVKKKVNMVLVDSPSIDIDPWLVHVPLLKKEILIIENVANMDKLLGKKFRIIALPLKMKTDGSPCRVVAEIIK